jgi:hypothetical protein
MIDFIIFKALRIDCQILILWVSRTLTSEAFFIFIWIVLLVFIFLNLSFVVLRLIISIDLSFFFDQIYHTLSTLTIFFVREILKRINKKWKVIFFAS